MSKQTIILRALIDSSASIGVLLAAATGENKKETWKHKNILMCKIFGL